MIVGYARVSTKEQNLDLQIEALKKSGCEKIYQDKVSGVKAVRPELIKCLANLKKGDVLTVWRLDRLGRSLKELISIVSDLKEKGVKFKSLMDGDLDTTTASGELVFNIFAVLAEFERSLIKERTLAGLSAARERGKTGGRPTLSPENPKVTAVKSLYAKNVPVKNIQEALGVSRATVYRFLKI